MLGAAFFAVVVGPIEPSPLEFERFATEGRLSHNIVTAMVQDRQGFLWFGTFDGLNRYDGYEFVTHRSDAADETTLSNNYVQCLLEDREGNLWIGTVHGLNRLDPLASRFSRYALPASSGSGREHTVYALFESRRGDLWVGTSEGLFRYSGDEDRLIPFGGDRADTRLEHSVVVAVQEDLDGALWVLSKPWYHDIVPGTLHRIDPDTQAVQQYALGSEWRRVHSFWIDRSGKFWLDGRDAATIDHDLRILLPPAGPRDAPAAWAFLEEARGATWIGTTNGVYRMEPGDRGPSRVDVEHPSRATWLHRFTRAILEDDSGAVWVGTQGGLYRHDPHVKPFEHLRHDPNDSNSLSADAISAVVGDGRGRLWVGTYGMGLNRLDRRTGAVQRYRNQTDVAGSLPDDIVWSLHLDEHGTLWVGSSVLASYRDDADRFVVHPLRLPPGPEVATAPGIQAIAEGLDGVLWLGTDVHGLVRYRPGSGEVEHYPATGDGSGPADNEINSILVDTDGAVWIAFDRGIFDRFDPSSGRFMHFPLVFADGSTLYSEAIFDLLESPNGSIWLGTASGLSVFDPEREAFRHFSPREGLPGAIVSSLLQDEEGRLWLATNRGLSRFDERLPPEQRFRNFDTGDGVGSSEFNRHARFRSPSGEMIFGGMKGLTSFLPAEIRENPYVPPIVLTRIEVFHRGGVRTLAASRPAGLRLSHRDYTFSFEFAALSFTDPAKNRYGYTLEGFDEGWVDAGTRRFASYTNIPAGDYVFRVRGSNNDGTWNLEGTSLALEITPPFWQTWLFRLLLASVLAALLIAAYRYRVARLLEMERLRLRIASDLHDDLGSDLSGMALAAGVVERDPHLAAADRQRLGEVRATALRLMDRIRDVVWYINPEHDTLEAMVRRMRSTAAHLLPGAEVDFAVDLATGDLDMDVRRNVFLIFKEAVTNVARHAQARSVAVKLDSKDSLLRLEVADDGVGFDPKRRGRGNGLLNLHRRASQIGGELDVDSRPGAGTRLSLTLKMARTRDWASARTSVSSSE